MALLLLCSAQSEVPASQAQSYPDPPVPIPHPVISLLRSASVHKELGLSSAQIKESEAAAGRVDLPLWQLRDLPFDKRNDKAASLILQLKEGLSNTLSEPQRNRLNQIVRQAEGIDALLEPEVAARLNLSAAQYGSIKAILIDSSLRLASLQRDTTISTESIRAARILQLQAQSRQSALAILNNTQRQTLGAITGRPFDFSSVKRIACKAPEFKVNTWINSSPVTISELRGKVTVVHFYAFGCGNCIRTLPYYNLWQKLFPQDSFRIIGIHRPETEQERILEKVKARAREAGIEYPVAVDNESLAWDAWANHIWPSIYLVDREGYVRYWWYGELNWQGAKSEEYLRAKIQELIDEKPPAEPDNSSVRVTPFGNP